MVKRQHSQLTAEFQPGDSVGEFRILRELGRGGESRVYLAEHSSDAQRVALKISEQCSREATILERLDHPGIVKLHSRQELGICDVLELEPLPGPSLADWLDPSHETAATIPNVPRERRRFVCGMILELAKAVEHVHAHGVWHLDIKPENVLLDSNDRPVLIDFNVARLAQAESEAAPSKVGGTLAYMSPEQLNELSGTRSGNDEVDSRSDIYALGLVFYELLTEDQLFPVLETKQGVVESAREALAERLRPERLSSQLRALARRERQVIAKCLAPIKTTDSGLARYRTIGEFTQDLQDLQAGRSPRNATGPASRKWVFASVFLVLFAAGFSVAGNMMTVTNRLDQVDQNLQALIESRDHRISSTQFDDWEAQIQRPAWIETDSLKNRRLRVEHHLGMAAIASGQPSRAARILERLVADHPGLVEAWHNLGIARFRLKDYSGAVAAFDSALERGADPAEVLASRAAAYGAMGKFEKARTDLELARESNPDSPAVRRQAELLEQTVGENVE